jgi:two-component system, NtrC family, response regulator AtoC
MSSDYSRRSQSERALLNVPPHSADRVHDERAFRKMARAQSVEAVLNTFREIEEADGVVLCELKLTCGGLQQEFTFSEAGTGNVHDSDIDVEGGQTRLSARLGSPASEEVRQKVEGRALMATYLIDRLNLQARLGLLSAQTLKGSADPPVIKGLRGDSEPMQKLNQIILKIAQREPESVLLYGESGTGKGVIARGIHNSSRRANAPFMSINCANLPAALVESELFGHEKGAFTNAVAQRAGLFEQAKGGTIFLDEIGELDLMLQSKLLGVLQERRFRRVGGNRDIIVDAKVIAASNRDLLAEVKAGRFRLDLFHRLAVVRVSLPPLRERGDDLFLIADYHIQYLNEKMNRQVVGLAPEVIELFRRYPWPGNVRELLHAIEHAMTLEDSDVITTTHLPPEIVDGTTANGRIEYSGMLNDGESLQQHLDRHGLEIVRLVLQEFRGNNTKAAQRLGLGRAGLANWKRRALARLSRAKMDISA